MKTSIIRVARNSSERRSTDNFAAEYARRLFEAEETARIAEDEALHAEIAEEARTRAAADDLLRHDMESVRNRLSAEIENETDQRIAADEALHTEISNNRNAMLNTFGALMSRIANEETARARADNDHAKRTAATDGSRPQYTGDASLLGHVKLTANIPELSEDGSYTAEIFDMPTALEASAAIMRFMRLQTAIDRLSKTVGELEEGAGAMALFEELNRKYDVLFDLIGEEIVDLGHFGEDDEEIIDYGYFTDEDDEIVDFGLFTSGGSDSDGIIDGGEFQGGDTSDTTEASGLFLDGGMF